MMYQSGCEEERVNARSIDDENIFETCTPSVSQYCAIEGELNASAYRKSNLQQKIEEKCVVCATYLRHI